MYVQTETRVYFKDGDGKGGGGGETKGRGGGAREDCPAYLAIDTLLHPDLLQ